MSAQQIPPELMQALMGGAGAGGGAPAGPPDHTDYGPQGQSDGQPKPEQDIREGLTLLQRALSNLPDDAESAKIAGTIQKLYELFSNRQDAHMSAMGGNPTQMRAMAKAYGPQ